MSMTCTRCNGTGFLNIEQVDDETLDHFDSSGDPHVSPFDCCGNGEPWGWYFLPGLHDWDDPNDPKGCR